jgi:predicted phage-related endonuclease
VRLVADDHRADIDMLLEYADRWWQVHVVGNSAPPVDGSDATRDALQRRWGAAQTVERIDLSEEWRAVLAERHRTQALIKDLESQRDELDCRLIAAMNGATDAFLPGDEKPSWTWRSGSRQSDRTKAIRDALAAELPLPEGVTWDELKTAVRVLDAYRQSVEYRRLDCKAPRPKKGTLS